MKKLSYLIHTEIEKLCDKGEDFLTRKEYSSALFYFWQAYDLLPEPKEDWVAGTWILTAIGDANFLKKDYDAGAINLATAINYFPGAEENPFLHLRLGQCYYELGRLDHASQELCKAYALEGESMFEMEHPKYFRLVWSKELLEEVSM